MSLDKVFAQSVSKCCCATPKENRTAHMEYIVRDCGTRCINPLHASLALNQTCGGNGSKAFAGNFATALEFRIVPACALIKIPPLSDVLDLGLGRLRKSFHVVRFFSHFQLVY